MATATTLSATQRHTSLLREAHLDLATIALCTTLAFLLLGYHPAAEDGGIYAAAAALRLDPTLFPAERGFAIAHTAGSLFIPLLAGLTRILHLPLPTVLLAVFIGSIAGTLGAAHALVKELFLERSTRLWALLTFTVSLGMPIAGTSLYLVDPYLTARSISTPLLLLALTYLLRRRAWPTVLCISIALVLHPMMTAWALLVFLALLARRSARPAGYTSLLAAGTLLTMVLVQWLGPADTLAGRAASLSRYYWFPAQWAWYEWMGLAAPPVILLLLARNRNATGVTPLLRPLALATTTAIAIAATGAFCLIHTTNQSLLLARVQPLRLLHLVYGIFVLILAGSLPSFGRSRSIRLQPILCLLAAASLLMMQRGIYKDSDHIEWPGRTPTNGYERAFTWVKNNTPKDALFALDAQYTTAPGENAQLFRAIALRSSLPDAAKDGGITSVVPHLADAWYAAAQAQTGLSTLGDRQRAARVRPLGATWMILPANSTTHFLCPYRNTAAQVCKLS